jgi:Glycosyltransferase Family 4
VHSRAVKIYWYWPHPHRASSPLCRAVMRPGDRLTVHALERRPNESIEPISEYDVIRDLPDPSVPAGGIVARITRRPRIALGRSTARARIVRRGFDVAHIGNLVYQTDWFDLRRLRRHVALVCDVHDVRPHRHVLPRQLETALLREEYRNGGHLIVLHDLLKQEIVADFGLDAARVHVVPHVLDASVVV